MCVCVCVCVCVCGYWCMAMKSGVLRVSVKGEVAVFKVWGHFGHGGGGGGVGR